MALLIAIVVQCFLGDAIKMSRFVQFQKEKESVHLFFDLALGPYVFGKFHYFTISINKSSKPVKYGIHNREISCVFRAAGKSIVFLSRDKGQLGRSRQIQLNGSNWSCH